VDHATLALDAAEELFYSRGVQAVSMADIRDASGVSLRRLYQLFPHKEELVTAYLNRRDSVWRARLAEHVDQHTDPDRRVLAVFDWLHTWFTEPGFRGCAWVNCLGELGSPEVAQLARDHKAGFRRDLRALVRAAGRPASLADHLLLLAEGAITTAAINGTPLPARQAKAAARLLMQS
jgi:AcrR family transcriptional regulator